MSRLHWPGGPGRLVLLLVVVVLCAPPPAGVGASAAVRAQAPAQAARITTASAVRVRAQPRLDAAEVAKLPLGLVVRELERTQTRETAGGREDYWYRVAAPGGAEGWVFGALTAPFDAGRRGEIYLELAAARAKLPEAGFAEWVDLVRFLERAVSEVTRRETLAELELRRLLALQKSLSAVPFEGRQQSPYAEWIKEQEERVVYSEPSGEWYVRSEQLWGLERKYRGLPVAQRIAWEAAQIPLPGECEGYLPCNLQLELLTGGAYLKLYPRGPHAAEALKGVTDFLAAVAADARQSDPVYHVPREDRAEFQKSLAGLRSIVSRVPSPTRAGTLARIDALARRFR